MRAATRPPRHPSCVQSWYPSEPAKISYGENQAQSGHSSVPSKAEGERHSSTLCCCFARARITGGAVHSIHTKTISLRRRRRLANDWSAHLEYLGLGQESAAAKQPVLLQSAGTARKHDNRPTVLIDPRAVWRKCAVAPTHEPSIDPHGAEPLSAWPALW